MCTYVRCLESRDLYLEVGNLGDSAGRHSGWILLTTPLIGVGV